MVCWLFVFSAGKGGSAIPEMLNVCLAFIAIANQLPNVFLQNIFIYCLDFTAFAITLLEVFLHS